MTTRQGIWAMAVVAIAILVPVWVTQANPSNGSRRAFSAVEAELVHFYETEGLVALHQYCAQSGEFQSRGYVFRCFVSHGSVSTAGVMQRAFAEMSLYMFNTQQNLDESSENLGAIQWGATEIITMPGFPRAAPAYGSIMGFLQSLEEYPNPYGP